MRDLLGKGGTMQAGKSRASWSERNVKSWKRRRTLTSWTR
jgi:hypothetical protein